MLANMFRKPGAKPVSPADLIPDWWADRAEAAGPKTVEDWKALLTAMVKARGGTIVHQGKADGK